ncbi:PREDICTED: CBL-interacting serine/threonine-protein kinase 20 [Tarenaya hassleriana]|uniref:CBL-interacting serine/threonine-protein kinase 20 n=1 Tax=Tarenaya hassleriana TaxID=28532 RepID=UPI00053C851C|nr:PREDICTED: CBL-interacting serine/threonine-protein kinase 20 [Tarenaya hassleriana]
MEKKGVVLMQRYELGRLLGQGTFAKVYHARNLQTGQSVAIKVIDKQKVMKVGLIDQIKREISVMRLVRHPNVVLLHEVMASRSKIYFAMEYVKGGELFNRVSKGKLKEDVARKYFQQLVGAIDYCHSRGVYHRDLKPENLLLDENGDLKISDFGLSALIESRKQDGLLHTTCGTPAYVAPEVLCKRGYDGTKADVWSCGVVLYVLLAGFLPFHESNLVEMYRKISRGEFRCPNWFPPEVKKLLSRILDPSPITRITLEKIMDNSWFKKGFKKIESPRTPRCHQIETFISDVHKPEDDNFSDSSYSHSNSNGSSSEKDPPSEGNETSPVIQPTCYNAFDIISSLSPGFDLSGLFEKDKSQKSKSRFTTTKPAKEIVSKFQEIAASERFSLKKSSMGAVKMEDSREGRKGQLAIDVEIFEVTKSFYMVEMKKSAGDTMEYMQFYDQELKPSLKDIVWKWQGSNGTEIS